MRPYQVNISRATIRCLLFLSLLYACNFMVRVRCLCFRRSCCSKPWFRVGKSFGRFRDGPIGQPDPQSSRGSSRIEPQDGNGQTGRVLEAAWAGRPRDHGHQARLPHRAQNDQGGKRREWGAHSRLDQAGQGLARGRHPKDDLRHCAR